MESRINIDVPFRFVFPAIFNCFVHNLQPEERDRQLQANALFIPRDFWFLRPGDLEKGEIEILRDVSER
jgi:hypothetical protein